MIIRYGTAVTAGSAVTLGLLWLMTTLTSLQQGQPIEPTPRGTLEFLRLIREEPVAPELLQQHFQLLTNPVDLPPPRPGNESGVDGTGIPPTTANAPEPRSHQPTFTGVHDGPLVAMVRVQPVYPIRATRLNLDGYVVVQFDVNPDGSVTNVSVVESSHPVFEKAAIGAAKKFRYKARVIDGVPQPSIAIQNIFRFRMERT